MWESLSLSQEKGNLSKAFLIHSADPLSLHGPTHTTDSDHTVFTLGHCPSVRHNFSISSKNHYGRYCGDGRMDHLMTPIFLYLFSPFFWKCRCLYGTQRKDRRKIKVFFPSQASQESGFLRFLIELTINLGTWMPFPVGFHVVTKIPAYAFGLIRSYNKSYV